MAKSPDVAQLRYHQLARVCPFPLRLGSAVCARRWADDSRAYHEPTFPIVGLDVHLDYHWRDRCQYADPIWEVRDSS
jgi:hypothetical protein